MKMFFKNDYNMTYLRPLPALESVRLQKSYSFQKFSYYVGSGFRLIVPKKGSKCKKI